MNTRTDRSTSPVVSLYDLVVRLLAATTLLLVVVVDMVAASPASALPTGAGLDWQPVDGPTTSVDASIGSTFQASVHVYDHPPVLARGVGSGVFSGSLLGFVATSGGARHSSAVGGGGSSRGLPGEFDAVPAANRNSAYMSDLAEQNGIGLTHRGQTIKPTYDADMSPMFYGETLPGEAGRITRVGPASFDANQGQVLNTVTHESIHARSIMDGYPNIEETLATAHGNLAQFRWGFRLGRGG